MALSTDTIPYIVFGSLAVIFGVPIFILSLGKCQPKWLKHRLSRNRPDKARHTTTPKGSQASAESAEIQLEEGIFEYHYMSRLSGTNAYQVDIPASPAPAAFVTR
ncbi:hypothetical protein ETB97_007051 [Aspergillus alliaceus]|uniref:Uncharacterized protein n=1 Tax=Petromyces alliaceus TaxID=209559 RepID=A0A8H5ZWQ8_PETAA|nr:hypothetical protein ETB97_007051 [Aspergillus burnettii]